MIDFDFICQLCGREIPNGGVHVDPHDLAKGRKHDYPCPPAIFDEVQVECTVCKAAIGAWCNVEADTTNGEASFVKAWMDKHSWRWVHKERKLASDARVAQLKQTLGNERGVDLDKLKAMMLHVGIDLNCAACAQLFYFGKASSDAHVCKPWRDGVRPLTHTEQVMKAREAELVEVCIKRNKVIALYKEEAHDRDAHYTDMLRVFMQLKEDLLKYGNHLDGCALTSTGLGAGGNQCTCNFEQARLIAAPAEHEVVAERIARWLEQGPQTVSVKIVAQQIRDRKYS